MLLEFLRRFVVYGLFLFRRIEYVRRIVIGCFWGWLVEVVVFGRVVVIFVFCIKCRRTRFEIGVWFFLGLVMIFVGLVLFFFY